jgi:hypothetical protein
MIGISPLKRVVSRFLLEPFEPAYLALDRAGELAERVSAGLRELEDCCACPRNSCPRNSLASAIGLASQPTAALGPGSK